ncbi:hypothetical protein TFKS16_2627 [Tannerella forsythia KS16]|uniref:Uncharacterized protein n=1 Tax=Tannerella forsythia (strain ATCC 43037 / JCM 10827 / CCUG 21028 A / KCTC 5666 / FDC 338) TaxID=203275 RepID=G8UNV3_TANFA|nr:hypothetical protein BFO_2905 [Tannerella forsythia 92A2]BAR49981.1 hypothetical protein TF3313_2550 [Tannerella forsythia 3313]BAR52810.1 hypothetical protein TFKS16_2627 [Tannerella forsythia KS16]
MICFKISKLENNQSFFSKKCIISNKTYIFAVQKIRIYSFNIY